MECGILERPDPIPTALNILSNLLSNPPSLSEVPISKPVLLRLRWIKPDPNDESFLYFNNMEGHGSSGLAERLRLKLANLGPTEWKVSNSEEVEYKVDRNSIQEDGLPEVFCRIKVLESSLLSSKNLDRSNSNSLSSLKEFEDQTLGLILKLEKEDHQLLPYRKLVWRYFDLQDLITPGLDTRPWFESFQLAANNSSSCTQKKPPENDENGNIKGSEQEEKDEENYWVGYESKSDTETGSSDFSPSMIDKFNSDLKDRIRNTPVYRNRAPSVASSIVSKSERLTYEQQKNLTMTPRFNEGPTDLLSKLSRTPLYKRAPSLESLNVPEVEKDDKNRFEDGDRTIPDLDIEELLESAGLVNLPHTLKRAAQRAVLDSKSSSKNRTVDDDHQNRQRIGLSRNFDGSDDGKSSDGFLEDGLNGLFQLYLKSNRSESEEVLGERFISLSHRIVIKNHQKSKS